MCSRTESSRERGFTLVEVMVVVSMLAIVVGIAAPSFRSFIGSISAKSTAFDLLSDLMLARSEAIKRNAQTRIQPVGGDWSQGWTVNAGAAVLSTRAAPRQSIAIDAPTAGAAFGPSGRLSEDVFNLNWTVSSSVEGVTARCLQITPTGAARAKPGACS